jgi:hypothetical protein
MCMVSVLPMMILAAQNDLKPGIGRVMRLMARWGSVAIAIDDNLGNVRFPPKSRQENPAKSPQTTALPGGVDVED